MSDGAARARVAAATALLALACPCLLAPAGFDGGGPSDLEVKATFVLNFMRLVNWGSSSGAEGSTELTVCGLSKSDFLVAVRKAGEGKIVADRRVAVKIDPSPQASRCQVLIVESSQYHFSRQPMSAVKNAPVLTIGNGPGFLDEGGMFELVVQDRKVRFDVNVNAIRRAGLDVSARLLHLARNLRTAGDGAF